MLRFPISISIGSGAHGAVAVCTVSKPEDDVDDDEEEDASAENWFFLPERVVVDLALHILRRMNNISCVGAASMSTTRC